MSRKKSTNNPPPVFKTSVSLDTDNVVRGMNAVGVGPKFAGADAYVDTVLVVGQFSSEPISEATPQGADALKVAIIYVHRPTMLTGLLVEDISYTFLRELAAIGTSHQ